MLPEELPLFCATFITSPPACCALSTNTSKLSPGYGSFFSSYPHFQMSGITETRDCQKKIKQKTRNERLWLHLPWDFLPFLCKNLDSPKHPLQHPVFPPENSLWGLPSKLWVCFPRTTFRLLFLSQLFSPQCGCHLQLLRAKEMLLKTCLILESSF